nr:MAG TPA: Protein of unknown function (DUF1071) [Caudoviricetes sp.]
MSELQRKAGEIPVIENNYFNELNSINVSEKTENKNGLTYLSWAWAWGELKKRHPDATYTIYEDKEERFYHTDGKTCWVKTGVTVSGIEHIEYLPVMDNKNKSIPADSVTSFDVNKAVQRSLTKAVARHGLGLYIYAGEDLPDEPDEEIYCADCNSLITSTKKRNGERWPQRELIAYSNGRFKRTLCPACQKKAFEAEKEAEKNGA